MGSLSHQLNFASLGNAAPIMRNMIPTEGSRFIGINIPDTRNQNHGSLKGTDDPLRTQMGMINGGIRGVLPCCGVEQNAFSVMGSRVLRRSGKTDTDFMNVPQGFAKSQNKGLAFDVTKPLNAPPQLPVDFCNPLTMRSRFSPAPFTMSR
jgi:hypothetical protein